ncbi:XF1762 family protein [Bacillus velezensis]|uniref:XF1762 family protein n=1 Tax=Bacillus velezensis TaxID=492670 RepID=UPI003784E183
MWYWLFIKEKTNRYLVLADDQVTSKTRWILYQDNYELISDCKRSRKEAELYAEIYYGAKKLKLETRPITLKDACQFVDQNHRHHIGPQGHKFSIGLYDGDIIIGVIIAGRPVSRHQDNGITLEVTRCCVKEAYKNGISKLYAAVCKIAKVMGYKKVITYTLIEEPGVSMRSVNFLKVRTSSGGSWSSENRQRKDKHPTGKKLLWVREL